MNLIPPLLPWTRFKFKKALVTGANGFLGKNLCQYLASKTISVTALSKEEFNLPKVNCIKGDITNKKDLEKATNGTEVVFHLAAQSHPSESQKNEQEDYRINVLGTKNVLEQSKKAGAKCLVFTSSSMVYGIPSKLPVNEKHPLSPNTVYGKHKLLAEQECIKEATKDFRVVIARLSNIFGKGQKNRVIPDLIEKSRTQEKIEILGNSADTRDFLHVSDAVRGLHLLAERGKNKEAYNIGSGTETEIKELAETIMFIQGIQKPLIHKYLPQERTRIYLDITKARKIGFRVKTSLVEGLRQTISE